MCEDLLEQTLTLTEKVLVDASIDEVSNGFALVLFRQSENGILPPVRRKKNDCSENKIPSPQDLIDEIMLVGGSTRIRRVQEILAERFPNTKIRDDIEPELAVAKGAAILVRIS